MKTFLKKARHWLAYASDPQRHRVPRESRRLYREIYLHSLFRLGSPPDIYDGNDYNNKIKWLMLYDQGPDIVRNSDKLAVRQFVRETVGETYLSKLYGTWSSALDIDFDTLPESFALKTNHDSGSVWLVEKKSEIDLDALRSQVAKSLKRTYGVGKGEWCYRYIKPLAFAEELLPSRPGGIPDYKFHCTAGQVRFMHYISNRASGKPHERIVLPDGRATDLQLMHTFLPGAEFEMPDCWEELISVSKQLSSPFKYVRVDLYVSEIGVKFGELTFYPQNGNYGGADQAELGNWLPIDRSTHRFYDPAMSLDT